MSRFQGINLPEDVGTRKMGLDILQKLNTIYAEVYATFTAIYISFTTQSLTATIATIGALTVSTINGRAVGNASGNIPVSNGVVNVDLRADYVNFEHLPPILEYQPVISVPYTLTTGRSGVSGSPVTISPGATVTIPSGYSWRILI